MNDTLWAIQAVLAVLFLLAGGMKVSQSVEALGKRMSWVNHYPLWFVRFIGVAEVLGALGLILPAATHILLWLTLVAAGGLAIIMIGATVYHISRREYSGSVTTIILFLLSVFIIYGRVALAPF